MLCFRCFQNGDFSQVVSSKNTLMGIHLTRTSMITNAKMTLFRELNAPLGR
jgi:hypothetical protein